VRYGTSDNSAGAVREEVCYGEDDEGGAGREGKLTTARV
jgi:hypothetical protein